MRRPLRLAIVGDTHYANPDYHRRALAGQTDNPNLEAGVRRHVRSTREVLPQLLADLRAAAPDLIVQLGDVVQGHCDDAAGDCAELGEALELLRGVGRPLLFARGTHEGRADRPAGAAYRQLYVGEIARTLGQPPPAADTSYACAMEGCRLIVLDYTTFTPGDVADRLLVEQLRLGAARGERVLLCGHPPLVPVARPFFSRLTYAATVLERLATAPAPIDAYFCGHTHNQAATLHRISPTFHAPHAGESTRYAPREGGAANQERAYWLPQLKGVPVGDPEQEPVPLSWVRPLLPPADAVQVGWAYLQGSLPGWFLVEVGSEWTTARWQRIGAGEGVGGGTGTSKDRADRYAGAGEVRWSVAGESTFVARPPLPPRPTPPRWPLRAGDDRVAAVRLRLAGTGSHAPHRVRLNGHDVGTLGILESFNAQQGLAIPPAVWSSIGDENELSIEPVASEERCLGGFVLEVTLHDGRVARTVPTPEWYATSTAWDGWRWATPHLCAVGPEERLRVRLAF